MKLNELKNSQQVREKNKIENMSNFKGIFKKESRKFLTF